MVTLTVNGTSRQLDVPPEMPLLGAVTLELTGTKYGCGMALCGACTVHVDGTPTRACVTPVSAVAGSRSRPSRGYRRRPTTRSSAPGWSSTSRSAASASRASSCRRPRCWPRTRRPTIRTSTGHGGEHLPLRHVPADPRGDPSGRRAGARRCMMATTGGRLSRRTLIKGGLAVGTGLVVASGCPAGRNPRRVAGRGRLRAQPVDPDRPGRRRDDHQLGPRDGPGLDDDDADDRRRRARRRLGSDPGRAGPGEPEPVR